MWSKSSCVYNKTIKLLPSDGDFVDIYNLKPRTEINNELKGICLKKENELLGTTYFKYKTF